MFVSIDNIVRARAQQMPYGADLEIKSDAGAIDIELRSVAQAFAIREAIDAALVMLGWSAIADEPEVTQAEMFPEAMPTAFVHDLATIDAGE